MDAGATSSRHWKGEARAWEQAELPGGDSVHMRMAAHHAVLGTFLLQHCPASWAPSAFLVGCSPCGEYHKDLVSLGPPSEKPQRLALPGVKGWLEFCFLVPMKGSSPVLGECLGHCPLPTFP